MSIQFAPDTGLLTLHTAHTSYQMWADSIGVLHHLYYGPSLGAGDDLRGTEFYSDCGFSPQPAGVEDRRYSLDTINQEYTGCGVGDYRIACLSLQNPDGSRTADLRFAGVEILPGKYALPGLPASFGSEDDCQTLRITLKDSVSRLTVTLLYGVFEAADVITRAVLFRNDADGPLTLNKAASACLDLPFGSWDLIHFQGRHCMERQKERMPLPRAVTTLRSARGASSHHHNPFAILAAPDAGEEAGECLGAMLVYSGNFKIECEVSQMGSTRLVTGISDENFSWTLAPGESFTAPEVLFSYSATGLGDLSHQYHRFLQDHVIRSRWKDRPRPVLLNNWEATYMDFDAERLYRRFWTGAAVTVRCNGLWIGSYGGMLELGTAPTSGYEVDPISEDEIEVFVTADTAAQIEIIPRNILISGCAPDLAGTQVRFDGVQFIAEEIGSGWCDLGFDEESGEEVRVASTRHLVDRTGDTLAVYTSPMADFVGLPLPEGSGSIEGLLTFFNRSYQLRITDFRRCDMNSPRF